MINDNLFKKLENLKDAPFEILSVYLGANTLQAPTREVLLSEFHSLLHGHLTKPMREKSRYDIEKIEQYISEYTPSARSLVIFSAGDDLWETIELEYALPTNIVLQNSPFIAPLQEPRNQQPVYLVLLIDRKKAIAFIVKQGEITKHVKFESGFVPQKVKSTNMDDLLSQPSETYYNNQQLSLHVEKSLEKIKHFIENEEVTAIIVGGHKPLFTLITESLPSEWQNKVAGYFVSELNIPVQDIWQSAQRLIG